MTTRSRNDRSDNNHGIAQVASGTDQGLVRSTNEDSCLVQSMQFPGGPGFILAAVADGMGGLAKGDLASKFALKILEETVASGSLSLPGVVDPDMVQRALKESVDAANEEVYKFGQQPDIGGTGTTLTAALIVDGAAYVVNVGDTRAYRYQSGHLEQLTTDHSWVAEQVELGNIPQEQIDTHPRRNIITRAIGIRSTVQPDYYVYPLMQGDQLLLCSDGLYPVVPHEQIKDILRDNRPEEACRLLIQAANDNGGPDNISVVIVKIDGTMSEWQTPTRGESTQRTAAPSPSGWRRWRAKLFGSSR